MNKQSQAEVIAFLSEKMNLPGHEPVDVIHTHGAVIFLSGTNAYKIKRDVRYDYLDFSTLQKRHDVLLRELELNAPAAPLIYRDVIAVTRDDSGQLQLSGAGKVVEWVLWMRRFDAADELENVAARGAIDDPMAASLGKIIAQYHSTAMPRTKISGSDLISAILDELSTAFATMTEDLGSDQVAKYRLAADHAFRTIRATLDTRGKNGHVRRCHGDLHLRNIVLIDGVPTLFDALEFDETLGTCDVLYDLAFLLMDLHRKGLERASNIVLNSYLSKTAGKDHLADLAVLPLFQSVRAAIRAMVAVQTAHFTPDNAALLREARSHLKSALAYLAPAPPQLVAVGGLSGTGKTVLAAALAPLIGAAPGAVHLRSDLERKALFGKAPLTRLPQSAYEAGTNRRVYDIMRSKAHDILSGGHSVILDATWLNEDERATLPALAKQVGAQFIGLWLTADTELLQRRVKARRKDASDADAAVVLQQSTEVALPAAWQQIDASGGVGDTCHKAQRILARISRPKA
ncbi:AAA family ATPase [Phaeovulum sp.]|uniref:bifunctional aminoglycoside phosphotransferase/ATP-binding protein n=1 Tax=Phaeovulum sp. TaxID=2934796 RepID=UPI0039E4FB44